ncbi:ComEC/Rec2 family competence protein [Rhizobium tubonense]|uniref:ComEC/Rec2 family competence protein n=1 Tax=Rhizobium tubonense TaxID=484088 RepID=UPI001FCE4D45|nr:ComEC/Rec2 family competence protein [Rhizobium tubonense]
MLLAQWQTWSAATIMLDSPVTTTVTGRVERREIDDRGRWRYIIDVVATDAPAVHRPPEKVSILARGQDVPFDLGDLVRGKARLTPPAGPALPGMNDFAFRAYFNGIGANGFFYGQPDLLSPAGDVSDRPFLAKFDLWLAALRGSIGDRIRAILPGDTGAFAASLVNDERRAISQETTEALRVSGLAHIIAISGLNMALSAGIFYVGMRYALSLFPGVAQRWPTKKIAALGALVTVTAYYFISGFGVSAERAFVMMAIMLVAVLFDRSSVSLRNVALSAIAILILSPSEALGPSFQMSFAATLALVSGYSLWTRRPMRERRFLALPGSRPIAVIARFFAGIASTSFIGGASTAIFSIEHFHRLATYGLVANLAAMPVVSFIVMPVGMLATLLMPFGLDYYPWKITGFGLDLVIFVAKTVAAWGGNIPFARLPGWFFPVIIAGFLLMTILRTRLRHAGALLIALSIASVALMPRALKPELLISEDGELVAIFHDGRLEPNRERPPDFTFKQWQSGLAVFDEQPPKMLPKDDTTPSGRRKPGSPRLTLDAEQQRTLRHAIEAALDQVPPGSFACHGKDWCAAILDNGQILVTIDDAGYLGPACETADIVVTPARLRLDRCRSGAKIFTAAGLRRTGSVEMDLSEDPSITVAFPSVERPWNRHRAYDWRTGTFASSTGSPPVSDSGGSIPPASPEP